MNVLALIVLLPLLARHHAVLGRGPRRHAGAAPPDGLDAAAWPAALALLLWLAPGVFAGEVLLRQAEWVPAIGLNANFRLDGLAWMFAAC
jgi:multicomponent K+:H+ antiporter subunit A